MLGKQIQPFALAQPQLENEILGRYLVLWLLESCRGCGKRLPLGLTHSLVFLQQVLKGQYNNQKTPVASVSSLELQPEPSKHHPWSYDKEETPPDLHAPPLLSSPHSGCPLFPRELCRPSRSCAGVVHPSLAPLAVHVGFWIKQCSFSIRCAW